MTNEMKDIRHQMRATLLDQKMNTDFNIITGENRQIDYASPDKKNKFHHLYSTLRETNPRRM